MSFLSRLFGRKGSGQGPANLEKRLESLEAEAATAAPGYVGTAFNRAGDVALRGDETARAVEYYGRAIDAFLQDGQREAARGVANKIIRVRPGAVRTLCTLTWLDLAARHSATALLHLRDYVEAAKAIDRTGLAASQVYEMARIVPESEFIGAVADALDVLDFSNLAGEVRGWVKSEGSPDAVTDPAELAEACLQAAIKSSQRGEHTIEDESDDSEGEDDDAAAAEAVDATAEEGASPDRDEPAEEDGESTEEEEASTPEADAVPADDDTSSDEEDSAGEDAPSADRGDAAPADDEDGAPADDDASSEDDAAADVGDAHADERSDGERDESTSSDGRPDDSGAADRAGDDESSDGERTEGEAGSTEPSSAGASKPKGRGRKKKKGKKRGKKKKR